jgi:transcriptional regulator with XRE-family HTH domain
MSEMESKWRLWVASAVKDLLAVTSTLKFPCSRQRVAQALKFYVDQITEGNVAELARQLRVPKNTFWLWYNGSNLPTLQSLLKICYCLNTSLLGFLTEELETLSQQQLVLPPSTKCKPRASARVFDSAYLRDLQQKLQEFLGSDKRPPLSMEQTAAQLGVDRRTIYRHFPDLCHKIAVKHDNYQSARYLEAVEQACAEVRRLVLELRAESLYPSEARVSKRMINLGYLRYEKVRATLREARVAVKG